ncbi:VC2046/SO_2500 family protein [Vibrio sp. CAU 1672]|uniref:VC2046/SO_2500 family protein n=1 Tax=Vibrio sp. CAU 1672 TaxID=3032594 RepID=UPI0023D9FFF5|nr:VC2046/SO_2500 family protein [Vibrio sp. CAU 1672]MDF2153856.1 VC2046/SO_2500 family protein [Vibrio sp. CAU 1672]
MQVHTLDKATIINELHLGKGINHAVHEGRRADFALILSMFSNDVRDAIPLEQVTSTQATDTLLRQQFGVSQPQLLRSDSSCYDLAAEQAKQFHSAGLSSAKFAHYLKPDALAYLAEDTFDLPEEVYHNLSGHERRLLGERDKTLLSDPGLYNQLITAQRQHQIQIQA